VALPVSFLDYRSQAKDASMHAVRHHGPALEVRAEPLARLGERYRRYRLADAHAEQAMAQSLDRWGQLPPVVVCQREEQWHLVDGFKRLAAARVLDWPTLLVRRLETADERTVKAAVYGLNRVGQHVQELEEAWLVQALVPEDGLSQGETAELLGRHKSWVCRRLALLEKLRTEVRSDLEVGVLPPSLARQWLRLPTGHQAAVLASARREAFTAGAVQGVVDRWLSAAGAVQRQHLLEQPREAWRLAQLRPCWPYDPRRSGPGNRTARHWARLLEELVRWLAWLRCPGILRLAHSDGPLLRPALQQVVQPAGRVHEETAKLVAELRESGRNPCVTRSCVCPSKGYRHGALPSNCACRGTPCIMPCNQWPRHGMKVRPQPRPRRGPGHGGAWRHSTT
jgi:ParB-like chromosome segregation protein Spo0J